MVSHDDDREQAPRPPGRDHPCICPHCGHSHGGYGQQASTVLDCLLATREALSTASTALSTASEVLQALTSAIEEEVLP